MDSLKKLLKIAQDFGKVAIVSEDGELLGVLTNSQVLDSAQSNALSLKASKQALDVEEINRRITSAQLEEAVVAQQGTKTSEETLFKPNFFGTKQPPKDLPFQRSTKRTVKMPNLVQEVIDPSFDFDSDSDEGFI